MKKTVLTMTIAAALASVSGCGGLRVSWVATASYNADAITQTRVIHQDESKK